MEQQTKVSSDVVGWIKLSESKKGCTVWYEGHRIGILSVKTLKATLEGLNKGCPIAQPTNTVMPQEYEQARHRG